MIGMVLETKLVILSFGLQIMSFVRILSPSTNMDQI